MQSLVSRMLALGTREGLPWKRCHLLYLPEETLRSAQLLYLYYTGDFQGLSDKLLFKNHWDLGASQTFLDRSLLKIFVLKSLKKMTS